MHDQLVPKTLVSPMPGYFALYYLDAAMQVGIDQLTATARVLDLATNSQAHGAVIEAITALHAMRKGIEEVRLENNQELAHMQMEAQRRMRSESGTQAMFGNVATELDNSNDKP